MGIYRLYVKYVDKAENIKVFHIDWFFYYSLSLPYLYALALLATVSFLL